MSSYQPPPPTQTMTPPFTIRLATSHYPREQAAALAVKLQALWTAEELRANARLIDQILARVVK